MIQRDDILSMEYLKKTEFTGCHQGMRYRLEQTQAPEDPEGGKKLMVTVWPEPFNYFKTPEEKKKRAYFSFGMRSCLSVVIILGVKKGSVIRRCPV